ncbi:MAG: hypothetical protein ABF293_00385 [Flavobacteriaceae bacterium]
MLKKVFPLFFLSLLIVSSCKDETTVYSDDLQDEVVLETNETRLQVSVSYDKSGVLDIMEESTLGGRSARNAADSAGDYPLTLVAQVKPPVYSGRGELTASHVDIQGNYAYVSYNSVGEDYFGAIEIINVSDPNNPSVTSRVFYLNADINAVKHNGGFVYIAGGVNAETSVTATSNSFVAKLQLSGARFDLGAGIVYGFQQGFNANDLSFKDGLVWVTSGKDGALTSYSQADLQIQDEVPFSDLRSLAIDGDRIAVLDAGAGVKVLDQGLQIIKEIPISSDFGDFSKKSIDFEGDKITVAEAGKGAGIYSYSSGTLVEYIPILLDPEGVDQGDIVTNAVAINDNVFLMANGGAGLCLSEDTGTETDPFGIIELEGSINYVASKDDYIFAASGREGLQIIKLNRPSESLESRCAALPAYSGSKDLQVPAGQSAGYRGSKRFDNITIGGSLILCGTWTVKNNVNIEENGLFEMNGTLVTGRNNKRRDIVVDENSSLRIEGNLTLFGDLVLNDGATLEFIGDNNVVNIFGSVEINGDVTITGNFEDIRDKF